MLSLCLTNYNRYEMLIEAFQKVQDDPRISEIIISDDASDLKTFHKVKDYVKDKPKIKLYRNLTNVGMSLNKRNAVSYADNEWVILFDSDNILDKDYLDALLIHELKDSTIYCPDFAKPEFDFREYSGRTITIDFTRRFGVDNALNMLLNCCNYVVNRDMYLAIYQPDERIKASDTIHFNYLWLKSGGAFYVVPNMQYLHRIHKGSGFLQDADYNLKMAEATKKLITQL